MKGTADKLGDEKIRQNHFTRQVKPYKLEILNQEQACKITKKTEVHWWSNANGWPKDSRAT